MVVGSDRVKEMKEKLNKYNGTHKGALYNFKKIHVHSAGQRDPDAEGTTGMSGTKMRDAASEKRFHDVKNKEGKVVKPGFRSGVPSHVSDEHAKELMQHTRKGMGLHENVNRGLFKAVFVTGGPGSGKDIVIREAIAESRAIELNSNQAYDYLADKQKLSEKTNDFRREAIRNRGPLIINGPADSIDKINHIKEELEDLGYSTMMVFVNTTNEVSQERNTKLSRMMVESIRYDKWSQAQKNKQLFAESFDQFIQVDNTGSLESIEEDITQTYLNIHNFIEGKVYGDISLSWLEKHGKLNISDNLIKEEKNVKINSKLFESKARLIRTGVPRATGLDSIPADNRPNDSNGDDLKWNSNSKRKTFIFRTYSEAQEPTLTVNPQPKETNFSKDKEQVKKKRIVDAPTVSQRLRNTAGVGPEFDTRQQGTVYPMSGLGDVTYREQKEFSSFRKTIKEYNGFQNDISIPDMGVGGTLNGATNFEPMQSYKDANRNIGTQIKIKKKNKQEK
jgi:predicted kinase